MKKKFMGVTLAIASMFFIGNVSAETTQRPDYAKGGTCTVSDFSKFKEALTITWGAQGNKSCDVVAVADGSTITITEAIEITDKTIWIGYDDETPTKLQVAAGGKITFDSDSTIILADSGTLEVVNGGIIDGQSSIYSNNTGKLIVDGENSKINLHDSAKGSEDGGIFGLDVEVKNKGSIAVTNMQYGIEVTDNNNKLTVDGGTVSVTGSKGYGISGNLVTQNDAQVTTTNNNYGLKLKSGSSIGGNTILNSTGNKTGDLALVDNTGGTVTIAENAQVTVDKIVNGNAKNKATLAINGDGTKVIYNTDENSLVIPLNGTITTSDNTIRYANHDITITDTVTVKNTSSQPIKIKTSDMKDDTGITLSANGSNTIQVEKITINGHTYTVLAGTKQEDIKLIANETPTKQKEEAKDPEPKTGDTFPIALVGMITLGLAGTYTFKKLHN